MLYIDILTAKSALVAEKLDKAAAVVAAYETYAKAVNFFAYAHKAKSPEEKELLEKASLAESAFKAAVESYKDAKKAAEKPVSKKDMAETFAYESYKAASQDFLFALDECAALIAREAAAVAEQGFFDISKADKKVFAAVTDSALTMSRFIGLKKADFVSAFFTNKAGKGRSCETSARDIMNIFRPVFSTRYDEMTGELKSFIDIAPAKVDASGKVTSGRKVKPTPTGRMEVVFSQFIMGKNGYGEAAKNDGLRDALKAYADIIAREEAAAAENAAAAMAAVTEKLDGLIPETESTIDK